MSIITSETCMLAMLIGGLVLYAIYSSHVSQYLFEYPIRDLVGLIICVLLVIEASICLIIIHYFHEVSGLRFAMANFLLGTFMFGLYVVVRLRTKRIEAMNSMETFDLPKLEDC